LDVLLAGVQVFQVRSREALGWRRAAGVGGLALLLLMCVGAWTREARGELSVTQVNECVALTAGTAIYALWAIRPLGVTWRFDHKRRQISRRHWLCGLTRRWSTDSVAGIRVARRAKAARGGRETVQVELIDNAGRVVAEVGHWDRARADLAQVETVTDEIRKVMWWPAVPERSGER
jgi:hypothetical protein